MPAPHFFPLRVYYEDTDFSGYVYHASYLRFMERARTEYLRSCGISHSSLLTEENGLVLVVSRMSLDYLRPAAMDDELTIVTELEQARGAVLRIAQQVRRGTTVLIEAKVLIAAVRDGRAARLPARVCEALMAFLARNDDDLTRSPPPAPAARGSRP